VCMYVCVFVCVRNWLDTRKINFNFSTDNKLLVFIN